MAKKYGSDLVVGVSSRALFDLDFENDIYEKQGVDAYAQYQLAHEKQVLKPGAGFALVRALLRLNELIPDKRLTEVIVMSRNSADTSLRIFNSLQHYGLDVTRAALSGGAPLAPYLKAFDADLFLSAHEGDAQEAIDGGIAAGLIYTGGIPDFDPFEQIDQIRIAFDGDAVLFSDESERLYKQQGLEAFMDNERKNALSPLTEGPFAKLLKTLSFLQGMFKPREGPIRTALVTARNAPAHERAILTLREWGVRIDEAFFLGGMEKKAVLKAFHPHIFFDDQTLHTDPASTVVPSARVPYKSDSTLKS